MPESATWFDRRKLVELSDYLNERLSQYQMQLEVTLYDDQE